MKHHITHYARSTLKYGFVRLSLNLVYFYRFEVVDCIVVYFEYLCACLIIEL